MSVASSQSQSAKHHGQTTKGGAKSQIQNRKLLEGRYAPRAVDGGTNRPLHLSANPKFEIQDGKFEVSFELAAYDPSLPLITDPGLSYSTFLGGVTTTGRRASRWAPQAMVLLPA